MAAAERPDLVAGLIFVDLVIFPDYFIRFDKLLSRLTGKSYQDIFVQRLAAAPGVCSAEAMKRPLSRQGTFRTWQDAFLRDYVAHATQRIPMGFVCGVNRNGKPRILPPITDGHTMTWKINLSFVLLKGEKGSTTRHPGASGGTAFAATMKKSPGAPTCCRWSFPASPGRSVGQAHGQRVT